MLLQINIIIIIINEKINVAFS